MAAALWRGGIGFGGVISFVFADLIAFPLLLVYRKYYGRASMLRMFVTFWALMATAGLVVGGRVPRRRRRARAGTPVPAVTASFHWNYTTVLNIVFIVVFGALLRLRARRARAGFGLIRGDRSRPRPLTTLGRAMAKIVDILASGPSSSFEFFPPKTPAAEEQLEQALLELEPLPRRSCR